MLYRGRERILYGLCSKGGIAVMSFVCVFFTMDTLCRRDGDLETVDGGKGGSWALGIRGVCCVDVGRLLIGWNRVLAMLGCIVLVFYRRGGLLVVLCVVISIGG